MSSAAPRIVILDAATYGDVSLDLFSAEWPCTVHQVTRVSETQARIAGCDIAITNKVAFDETVLNSNQARDLKLIAVAATGTDIIDKTAASKRGVKVCNVPGYATQSVAQFTMGLILELATSAAKFSQAVRSGAWQQSPVFSLLTFPNLELAGKKLGIIGYGNIGACVARMANSFGMEILIAARSGDPTPSADRMSHDELFRRADFISLHCPLTGQTKNLIDEKSLSVMKPTAFVVNTARGALIDELALISALRHRRIAGAAVDVITQEPPAPDHPMVLAAAELPNLIVTPHTAWSARQARERLLSEVKTNIAAFLNGQDRNLVG